MNVFLRTRLFRDAVGADSGTLRIEYASAYSIVPGRIHVESLAIRGRDSNVEWILTIDRCDFHQSFFDLLHRRFHASHVRGEGLSMRLRQRLTSLSPAAGAVAPVPGFLDPPLADVGPPPPALTDADYRLWSVQLDDVVAEHVRELWIDTVRETGDLRVEGRWFFRPLRWLDLGPATIDLRSANVFYGADAPLALDLHGTIVGTLAPADIRDAPAGAMVDHLQCDADVRGAVLAMALIEHLGAKASSRAFSAAVKIEPAAVHVVADHSASTVVLDVPEAQVDSLTPLRTYLPLPDGLDIEAKRATLALHAEGNLTARSLTGRLKAAVPNLTIQTGDQSMTGTLSVDVPMKARDSALDVSGTEVAFASASVSSGDGSAGKREPGDDGKRDPTSAGWWLRVHLADARLSDEGDGARFHASLSASAKDGSPASAFIAKTTPLPRWLIDTVPTEHLRVAGEIRMRPAVFEVRSVEARAEGSTFDFEFEKLAYWKEWALLLQAGPVHAGVRSGDGGTEVVLFNAQPWFTAQKSAFRTNASRER